MIPDLAMRNCLVAGCRLPLANMLEVYSESGCWLIMYTPCHQDLWAHQRADDRRYIVSDFLCFVWVCSNKNCNRHFSIWKRNKTKGEIYRQGCLNRAVHQVPRESRLMGFYLIATSPPKSVLFSQEHTSHEARNKAGRKELDSRTPFSWRNKT